MAASFHDIDDELSKTLAALGGRELAEGPFSGRTSAVEVAGRSFTITWSRGDDKRPPSVLVATAHGGGDAAAIEAGYREAAAIVDPRPVLLRREGARDRLGTRIGLNREVQTGDREFDDGVYVESDASHDDLGVVLRRDRLRAAVQTILDDAPGARITLFEDDGRKLHVSFPVTDLRPVQPEPFRALLDAIARGVEDLPPITRSGRKRPPDLRKIAMLAIIASTILGVVFAVVASSSTRHVGSDHSAVGVLVGSFAWLLATPLVVLFFRGRSTALRDVVVATFALAFALPCWSTGALTAANAAGVDTAPERHQVQVLRKWKTTGKNTAYRALVSPYRPGGSELSIALQRAEFKRLPATGAVVLTTRAGRLGWDLLVSIEPTQP